MLNITDVTGALLKLAVTVTHASFLLLVCYVPNVVRSISVRTNIY